jgi:hypothetical protein
MSAAVLAFPVRPYARIAEASRCAAAAQNLQGMTAKATPVKPEPDNFKELLALLRRIDRRLAKMADPGRLARQADGEA